MHVFEVVREGWTAFWDRSGADALFAPRGWTEMAALHADLHLFPPASSASPLRLFLAACHSASGDGAARGIDATFLFISRARRRLTGRKIRRQHRRIRKFLQEISGWTEFNTFLAPSSVPLHSSLIAFSLPHNSPNSATPLFFFPPSSCLINTNTNCAARQLHSIHSSPPNQIPTHAITQHQN